MNTLSQNLVNVVQVPDHIYVDFSGDYGINGVQLKPVKCLPMIISLVTPKIPINVNALYQSNVTLENLYRNKLSRGPDLEMSDKLVDTALDYQYAREEQQMVSPLVFYINPSSLTRSYTKSANSNLTAGATHVVEHSFDQQKQLSASGKMGPFFTDRTGLTTRYARNSFAYNQLMHLYIFYRNNGYLYETRRKQISNVGAIKISYDSETWIGHFNSFTLTESSDTPNSIDYAFEFTVSSHSNNMTLRRA